MSLHDDDEFIAYVKLTLEGYEKGMFTRGEVSGRIGYKFAETYVPDFKEGETVKLKFAKGGRFIWVGDDCDLVDAEEVMDS